MSLFGKKPAPKPAVPVKTEAANKAVKRPPQSKEDRLREMIEKDPEQAAALLRELFLKNK